MMLKVRHRVAALVISLIFATGVEAAQSSRPPISSPSVVAPPTWWRIMKMPDGRTFVTDGGLFIDAKVAKPASLPSDAIAAASAKVIEEHFNAPHDHELGLQSLRPGDAKNTFTTPDGVVLNGNYITFIRSVAPPARTRLRTRGKMQAVVVLIDGQPVAVMMPVAPSK